MPHISINCVVLGYRHPGLQVLVYKMPGFENWMLPGGYVKRSESLDEAAYRNLDLVGISRVFLRQIKIFGEVGRVSGFEGFKTGNPVQDNKILTWVGQRFVSVVYYGLINFSAIQIAPGGLMNELTWLDVNKPEKMAMDHADIVEETRKILGTEILSHPVASSLLPDLFTLNELRGLFEAILDRSIDRGTFRRKILKSGILEQVDQKKDSQGRPSHLYRFNREEYKRFLEEKTKFGF